MAVNFVQFPKSLDGIRINTTAIDTLDKSIRKMRRQIFDDLLELALRANGVVTADMVRAYWSEHVRFKETK